MADFNQTITNGLTLFGASPASLWGTMVWGEDNWGVTNDFPLVFEKSLSESISLTDSLDRVFQKVFSETLIFDYEAVDIQLISDGYNYVFPGDKENLVSQVVSDYTPKSASETSFTQVSFSSSIWT